ncbi:MAG: membrane protein insertion efficiency factor YidD [Ruthenibacterium sp.]
MIKKCVLRFLRFYQKFVSPAYRSCCRFTPTCSVYAYQAVEEWGVIRGIALAIWRVLRCNPCCRAGDDPVPIRQRKEKELHVISK